MSHGLKFALEAGPLLIFFIANYLGGIFLGTGLLIGATIISVIVFYRLEKKWPVIPLVSCVFVSIFGGLTIFLHDDMFIKLKPTIVNLFFGATLLGGYLLKKNLLKYVMGTMLPMKEKGWEILTIRWALFFIFLAALNEYVWRHYSTDTWATFKVFGVIPITLVFSLFQMPVILRYQEQEPSEEGN